jgi:hypothetical protein
MRGVSVRVWYTDHLPIEYRPLSGRFVCVELIILSVTYHLPGCDSGVMSGRIVYVEFVLMSGFECLPDRHERVSGWHLRLQYRFLSDSKNMSGHRSSALLG